MKSYNSSKNKKSSASSSKKPASSTAGNKKTGQGSSDLSFNDTLPLVNSAIDIGNNIAILLTEKERTKQVAMECQRDIVDSNNKVEIARLEMEGRRNQRIAESEKDQRAHDREMRKIDQEDRLLDKYLDDRDAIIADWRAGKISDEQYHMLMDRIEKGID